MTVLVGVLGFEVGDLVLLCFHKADGDLIHVLVASTSHAFKGAHQVSINQLKGRRNVGVFGVLRVSQLVTSYHGANVTVID